MSVFKDGDVSLTVVWEHSTSGLLGRYALANAGRARLLVFDRLYQTTVVGSRVVDPELAWRWLEPDGIYRVAKFVPQVPAGRKVESPEFPYARLLEPQSRLTGTVLLPARLDQLRPYDEPAALAAVAKISGIVLTLGFAEIDDQAKAHPIGDDKDPAYSLVFDWAMTRQRLISSDVTSLQIAMQAPR